MGATSIFTRRHFLRGSLQQSTVFRPPWSPAEADFIDQCRRCGDCVSACETYLLKSGSGGFPEADFSHSHCSFCQACAKACQHDVIKLDRAQPWSIEPKINSGCLALNKTHCRTCQEHCEAQAITFQLKPGGVAHPQINPDICTGCGECVAGCPVNAISMKKIDMKNIALTAVTDDQKEDINHAE